MAISNSESPPKGNYTLVPYNVAETMRMKDAAGPTRKTASEAYQKPLAACVEACFRLSKLSALRVLTGGELMLLLWREWRLVIVAGIVCLAVGVVIGRFTASGSRMSDVSVDSKTYATCMALWRDVADCAEVMKRLDAWKR